MFRCKPVLWFYCRPTLTVCVCYCCSSKQMDIQIQTKESLISLFRLNPCLVNSHTQKHSPWKTIAASYALSSVVCVCMCVCACVCVHVCVCVCVSAHVCVMRVLRGVRCFKGLRHLFNPLVLFIYLYLLKRWNTYPCCLVICLHCCSQCKYRQRYSYSIPVCVCVFCGCGRNTKHKFTKERCSCWCTN